jgi:hypothetical protein
MTTRRKIVSALAASLITLSSLSAPAAAGSLTMVITPHGDAANMLLTGLKIYSLVEQEKSGKHKNHAKVDQKGSNNEAALSQTGAGNYGLVVQRGKGNSATASQAGFDNALGIFQFGKNTNVDVAQSGNGKASIVLQGGW